MTICFSTYGVKLSVSDLPTIDIAHTVELYYLEGSFPYNVPPWIASAAGMTYVDFVSTVAGLGVWDTVTNTKFSVQFMASSYIGSLLPNISSDGTIVWNNKAQIVVTYPLIEDEWVSSRHIATTNGGAYSSLANWLKQKEVDYATFQPVTVVFPTSQFIQSVSIYTQIFNNNGLGSVILKPKNSYSFMDDVILQLSNQGCSLGAFLQVYGSAFSYLSSTNTQPLSTLNLVKGTATYNKVSKWYKALSLCYKTAYQKVAKAKKNDGASYFLTLIPACYNSSHAYIYATPTSVYNITLLNASQQASPVLYRTVVPLPGKQGIPTIVFGFYEWLLFGLAVFCLCTGSYYYMTRFVYKKVRRRVSFEGDRIAAKTVEAIVVSEEDTINSHNYFYRSQSHKQDLHHTHQQQQHHQGTFFGWMMGTNSKHYGGGG